MAGMIAALMSGGPIALPSLPCALCLAISSNEVITAAELDHGDPTAGGFIAPAKTLAGGWLVCEFHAEVMAHQLAETNYSNNGGPDTITAAGARRPLGDSFTLPPAVMA